MHQDSQTERWEVVYMKTNNQVATGRFGNHQLHHCPRVEHAAFRPEVESVLVSTICVGRVQVHQFLAPPVYLGIHWGAILARKASIRLVLMKHCRVSSCRSLMYLCPGSYTPCCVSSHTLARCFLIRCCISCIAVHENPALAILAVFMARRMSDCSSCT